LDQGEDELDPYQAPNIITQLYQLEGLKEVEIRTETIDEVGSGNKDQLAGVESE
jgi:hypothetical protein